MKPAKNSPKTDPALNLAIRYLSYQPRTVHEMKEYLKKKAFKKDHITEVIQLLLEKRYLDDQNFASMFLQSKVKYKPKSKFAFSYDLKKKGINQTIIDEVLDDYDDNVLALKSIKNKFHLWVSLDDEKFKKKVMNFLRYRGFGYEVCHSTLSHFLALKEKEQKEMS